MTLDADALVDRRRTRRKLVFWRAAAFVIAAVAILAGIAAMGGRFGDRSRTHLARVTISGVILEDRATTKMLEEIGKTDAVAGVIVAIDSPGGSTTGGEALYVALRDLAAKKPTVATVGTLAASAGYMTAIAADHIVAKRTSITGSIGVYFQYGNVTGLLDKLGITIDAVKSAPLKAEPSPFTRDPPPEARAMIARLIDDSYQWFVDIVAERRKLDRATALRLADGSIYSGRQALDAGLVDAIGGEETAIAWLTGTRKVEPDLPVVDWTPVRPGDGFGLPTSLVAGLGALVGLDVAGLAGAPALDGLVSVWHPQLTGAQ